MQKIEGKQIHVILPHELIVELDRISKRQGHSRSDTMRIFLEASAELYSDFEKLGVLRIKEIIERTSKTVKRSIGQQKLPTL